LKNVQKNITGEKDSMKIIIPGCYHGSIPKEILESWISIGLTDEQIIEKSVIYREKHGRKKE
jgi:hypothetical protein